MILPWKSLLCGTSVSYKISDCSTFLYTFPYKAPHKKLFELISWKNKELSLLSLCLASYSLIFTYNCWNIIRIGYPFTKYCFLHTLLKKVRTLNCYNKFHNMWRFRGTEPQKLVPQKLKHAQICALKAIQKRYLSCL